MDLRISPRRIVIDSYRENSAGPQEVSKLRPIPLQTIALSETSVKLAENDGTDNDFPGSRDRFHRTFEATFESRIR